MSKNKDLDERLVRNFQRGVMILFEADGKLGDRT